MMTILSLFSVLCLLMSVVPVNNDSLSFYVKRNSDHRQPMLDSAFSYIEQYDAFYVDKRHGDDCVERVLYLTFDAGYENGNVEKILDVLKSEGVPGAFFILDNLIKRNASLVRRMRDEGHLVCNHTMRHRDMSKISDPAVFAKELHSLEDLYREEIGGEMAKYYRPPEGRFSRKNLEMAQALGYKTVFWSFAYADWDNAKQPSEEAAVKKILDNTHNGAIILLHPTSATNAAILPRLIREWRSMGYRFGSLDELGAS